MKRLILTCVCMFALVSCCPVQKVSSDESKIYDADGNLKLLNEVSKFDGMTFGDLIFVRRVVVDSLNVIIENAPSTWIGDTLIYPPN